MSADERRRGEEVDESGGPGAAYQTFLIMEELLDKLKLLNYEATFCRQLGFKPFSRHYFALQTNPGEQFFAFTSIAAWLLQMCGRHFEQPQEYDDPNATISSILDEIRQFNYKPDFPPNKLKTGCGEHCIWVLDRLADEALKAKNFVWKQPIYPEEEMDEANIIDETDDNHLELNKPEDDLLMADSDDEFEEEGQILGLDDLQKLNRQEGGDMIRPEVIMQSNTDVTEWKLELERVLPQLKLTLRTDNKDWRVHSEQMHQHRDGIENNLKDTKTYLDKLYTEITRTLEKIGSREKYINNQLEHLLSEFRSLQDQLAETKERYREASGGVTERTRTLAEVTEELERIKQEMEERGSSMTDGAPLVKIKQAINKLKQESVQMDIRVGVLQHILLQAKLKERTEQSRAGMAPAQDDTYDNYKGF